MSDVAAEKPRDWSKTAAGWRKWFYLVESAAQPVSDALVEMAGVAEGHRVLDLATGLGEPAVTAARRVGPMGHVLATDRTQAMLDFGIERAEAEDLGNIEFRIMDMTAIDVPRESFDAALCRWGLMFVPDLVAVLSDMRQVLKPDARFATAVWGLPERAPSSSLAGRVIKQELGLDFDTEGANTPFALSDSSVTLGAFKAAGFGDIESRAVDVRYVFQSAEEYAQFRRDRSSVPGKIEHLPEADQERAWAAVVEAARDWEREDGKVEMSNEAVCVAGKR